jgi:putative ABC transport system permease protein
MLHRFFLHPLRLGIQSLRLHKLRSMLTMLGVVFGVGSVIVMLAIGEGARQEALRAIQQLGATNIIIQSVKPPSSANSQTLGAVRYGLTLSDIDRLRAMIPQMTGIAPTRHHRRDVWYQDRRVPARVVGVTAEYQDLHNLPIASGRFICPVDCQRSTATAVLGASAARVLFPLGSPIGQSIRIGEDLYFQVIGVVATRASSQGAGENLPAEDFGRDIYIPFPTDLRRFGENIVFDRASSQPPEKVEVSQLTVSLPDEQLVKPAARIIESFIEETDKQDETAMTVPLDLLENAERTQQIFTWVLTAIASISLLVGGIGIMNIMLATVTERTREIGIRRALGARRSDIVSQFLVETTVLSCGGGILGIALGLSAAHLASQIAGVPAIVQPWSPLIAFGISVAVGLVFGIYPARRAAGMDPVQALRNE